eukprot:TRINITY_DN4604_c0_g1_i1.p2 TRINITY_DN4604_c0_g1~~TRINITY_DN4604_c0_g1_i1.p2  ORF type:complete len:215 (-),score=35.24 TRINITY_DN4604_c0_g1_i1:568-1212(-)
MSDAAALRAEIQRARAAETKAKAQVYTLRGKKGLQAMAAAMGEEIPPQLASSTSTVYEDPEDSPQIQELRRQIALLKEMEEQQRQQIEELKAKKEALSSGQTLGVKAQRFRGHTSPHRNVKEKKSTRIKNLQNQQNRKKIKQKLKLKHKSIKRIPFQNQKFNQRNNQTPKIKTENVDVVGLLFTQGHFRTCTCNITIWNGGVRFITTIELCSNF